MDPKQSPIFTFAEPPGPSGGHVEAIGPGGERFELVLTPTDVHTAEDLSTFLAGYKQAGYRADEVVKPVPVDSSEFNYRVFSGDDAFLEIQTNVGLTDPPVDVDPKSTVTPGYTENHSVGSLVPVQTDGNARFSAKQVAGKRCMNAIQLGREIRIFNLVGTATNWATGNRFTLGTDEEWNDGTASNPIKKLNEAIEASLQPVTGIWFNEKVKNVFLRHAEVRDHMRQMLGDKGAGNIGGPNTSDFSIPGYPPFHISKIKRRTTAGGAASYVLGDHVVLVTSPPGIPTDGEEVASAYNFREKGDNNVGVNVMEWFVQGRGVKGAYMINVTMAEKPYMVGNDSGGHIASVIV